MYALKINAMNYVHYIYNSFRNAITDTFIVNETTNGTMVKQIKFSSQFPKAQSKIFKLLLCPVKGPKPKDSQQILTFKKLEKPWFWTRFDKWLKQLLDCQSSWQPISFLPTYQFIK